MHLSAKLCIFGDLYFDKNIGVEVFMLYFAKALDQSKFLDQVSS